MTPDQLTIACRQAAYDAARGSWVLDDDDYEALDCIADAVMETVLAAYGEIKK